MPIYLYLQLLFFITELALLIVKRSKQSGVRNQRDKRSLLILWIVIASCLMLGPYSTSYNLWALGNFETVTIIGSSVFAIGFIIRWIAIYQLGKMFTVDVAIADEHILKTNGLYNVVRHPSYLGLMLIIAGLGICLNSGLSLLIMLVPIFTALNYRIKVEERALTDEFNEQYIVYKSRVNKIVPFIY